MLTHSPLRPTPLPPDPAADFSASLAASAVIAALALGVSASGHEDVGSRLPRPYISLAEQVSSCEALLAPKISSKPDGIRPDCRAKI